MFERLQSITQILSAGGLDFFGLRGRQRGGTLLSIRGGGVGIQNRMVRLVRAWGALW